MASNALLSEALYGAEWFSRMVLHNFQTGHRVQKAHTAVAGLSRKLMKPIISLFLTELAIEYYEKKGSFR